MNKKIQAIKNSNTNFKSMRYVCKLYIYKLISPIPDKILANKFSFITCLLQRFCNKYNPSCVAGAILLTYKSEECQVGYRPGSSILDHWCAMPMTQVQILAWTFFSLCWFHAF